MKWRILQKGLQDWATVLQNFEKNLNVLRNVLHFLFMNSKLEYYETNKNA
jgi:hypothetical protein